MWRSPAHGAVAAGGLGLRAGSEGRAGSQRGRDDTSQPGAWATGARRARRFHTEAAGREDQLGRWERLWEHGRTWPCWGRWSPTVVSLSRRRRRETRFGVERPGLRPRDVCRPPPCSLELLRGRRDGQQGPETAGRRRLLEGAAAQTAGPGGQGLLGRTEEHVRGTCA